MVKSVDAWLLPDGVADVLPAEAARLESLRRRILDHFSCWGYELVFPPLIEFLDSLLTGSGRDLDGLTFKITDQLSGRMMGVRADMTPQVARLDAHCLPVQGPARYCYAGSLLQTRPSGLSASRCPVQIGAELYGHAGVDSDIEVISLMLSALKIAGAQDIHVDLGHVGIFRSLIAAAELSAEQECALQDVLSRKAMPEWREMVPQWVQVPALQEALLALPLLSGQKAILTASALSATNLPASIKQALTDLEQLLLAVSARHPDVTLFIDLGELRGYHYHTGIVFAAYVPGQTTELAKGGRYDHVGEAFGRARPATGFSADLKQWLQLSARTTSQQGVLAPAGTDSALLSAVAALREQGERVLQQLPGALMHAHDAGCNRELVLDNGHWVVRQIVS